MQLKLAASELLCLLVAAPVDVTLRALLEARGPAAPQPQLPLLPHNAPQPCVDRGVAAPTYRQGHFPRLQHSGGNQKLLVLLPRLLARHQGVADAVVDAATAAGSAPVPCGPACCWRAWGSPPDSSMASWTLTIGRRTPSGAAQN
jgi:hypothetical protein